TCSACGGADKACDGTNDLTPAAIGFAATCPSVTVPGGSSCAGSISTMQDVVACVGCVTEFKVDCMDRVSAPAIASYPAECNPYRAAPIVQEAPLAEAGLRRRPAMIRTPFIRRVLALMLGFSWLAIASASRAEFSYPFVTFESGQVRPLALSPDG